MEQHDDEALNKAVDKLAKRSAKNALNGPLGPARCVERRALPRLRREAFVGRPACRYLRSKRQVDAHPALLSVPVRGHVRGSPSLRSRRDPIFVPLAQRRPHVLGALSEARSRWIEDVIERSWRLQTTRPPRGSVSRRGLR